MVVTISDIFLLACPTSRNTEEEDEMRKNRERAFRQKRLQFAEMTGRDPLMDPDQDKNLPKDRESFGERALKKIVNNLQVSVERVHVRFEDGVTSSRKMKWAMGMTLEVRKEGGSMGFSFY